jgi:hypothetical protein
MPQAALMARIAISDKTEMIKQNLAYYRAVAEESRQPFAGKSRVPIPDNPLAARIGFAAMVRPRHIAFEVITDLLRTEVALYRYRADRGRFPDYLHQLVPVYLKTVPEDPFGGSKGRSLRYRLVDGGRDYLLYSLGPDQTDDNGLPQARVGWSGPGDIVARKIRLPRRTRP